MPLSIDEIFTLEDDVEFAVNLGAYAADREEESGYDSLQPAERVVYCIDSFEREVEDGGLAQFFVSPAGDKAQETRDALRAIGAERLTAILTEAMDLFPGGKPPLDLETRCDLVDDFSSSTFDVLERLDEEFHSAVDDIAASLRRFAESHRGEFRPSR